MVDSNDISNITNIEQLKGRINGLMKKYKKEIGKIEKEVGKIEVKKSIVTSKIKIVNKEIEEVKKALDKNVKVLEEDIVKNLEEERKEFKNTEYFDGLDNNTEQNNSKNSRDESLLENDYLNNSASDNFGYNEKNENNYTKPNFFIEGIKEKHTIPQTIQLGYSSSKKSKSKKYIGPLYSLHNDIEKKVKVNYVNYYEQIKKGSNIHQINVPDGYKVATNHINFSNKNISYNIAEGQMGSTFLLFSGGLKENTKIKIGLVKDSSDNNSDIDVEFKKEEIGRSLNSKNRKFLDNINPDLSNAEKVDLVRKYIRETSYYVAGGIKLKEDGNLIWKVEHQYEKYLKNGKRPLICNLANNQFSAYLNYLGIKSAYITGLSNGGYGEYMGHGWIKYFDGEKWLKDDATPSPDGDSDLKTSFSNPDIAKIKEEKEKAKEKIKNGNEKKKPLEKEKNKLEKDISKKESQISKKEEEIKELEKILNPEKRESIEQTVENSKSFDKIMKDFGIDFLKNIQSLKQEKIILEPKNRINGKIIMYEFKSEDDKKYLEKFNKKLDGFLKNNINILTSALNNENLDFGAQYSYLILLTSLLNNFRGEVFKIDPNLSKKIDVIKTKIKNESLFLDEIKSLPELSYIGIGKNILIKKGKFDFKVIDVEFDNSLKVYMNGKEENLLTYEKNNIRKSYFLGKEGIKELKEAKGNYLSKDFTFIDPDNLESILSGSKDYLNIKNNKDYDMNDVYRFDVDRYITYGFHKKGVKESSLILNFDTYERKIFNETIWSKFKNFEKSIGDDKLLFFDKKSGKLTIKNNDLTIFKSFDNVKDFNISGNFIEIGYGKKNIKGVDNILYEIKNNSIIQAINTKDEDKEYSNYLNKLFYSISFDLGHKDFEQKIIDISILKYFVNDYNIARSIIKNLKNEGYKINNFSIGNIIQGEDGYKYSIIKCEGINYIFRSDGKMIKKLKKDGISFFPEVDKVDIDGNIFVKNGSGNYKIINTKGDDINIKKFTYDMKKVSFNINSDGNKIEYQAYYKEKEYIKEFEGLLERKSIEYFDKKDFEFVIDRMGDFVLSEELKKKYEEAVNYYKKNNKPKNQ